MGVMEIRDCYVIIMIFHALFGNFAISIFVNKLINLSLLIRKGNRLVLFENVLLIPFHSILK